MKNQTKIVSRVKMINALSKPKAVLTFQNIAFGFKIALMLAVLSKALYSHVKC